MTNTADRRGRPLSKSQRRDISWALQQKPGVFAHGINVHGVKIIYRHEGRRKVDTHDEQSEQRKMRETGAEKVMRKPRKVSEARKGRAERYGHAMHFLKGTVFRRWLGLVVQRNLNPARGKPPTKLPPPALLLPPEVEQQCGQRMDDERVASKRPHETPVRAQREPRSPGGTTYAAQVLAGLGSSSTESTPAARPAKTRSIGGSSANERSRSGQG
ncbi:hypothetical protein OAO87_03315 [bacterium]|nr:hypothetical protein [bacterium]